MSNKNQLIAVTGSPSREKDVTQILESLGYLHFDLYSPIVTAMSGLLGVGKETLIKMSQVNGYITGTDIKVSDGIQSFSKWCNDELAPELLSSLLLEVIEPHLLNGKQVVVTGVRTTHQKGFIEDLGGQIWRLGKIKAENTHILVGDDTPNSELIMAVHSLLSDGRDHKDILLINQLKTFVNLRPENKTSVEVDRMSLELLPACDVEYSIRIGRLGAALAAISADGRSINLFNNDINAIIYADQEITELFTSPYLRDSSRNLQFLKLYFDSKSDEAINELRSWWLNNQEESSGMYLVG